MTRAAVPRQFDHLIFGTRDLAASVEDLEKRLGIATVPGGSHPGRGTRNALIPLGNAVYVEIMGPDPAQPEPVEPRWLGIDRITSPGVVGWAAKGTDLPRVAAEAAERGVHLGRVRAGGRRNPEGVFLSWEATDPDRMIAGGVVPFLIDWRDTAHPGTGATPGISLAGFRAQHPEPDSVGSILEILGIDLEVENGPAPALFALIRTPGGMVELGPARE